MEQSAIVIPFLSMHSVRRVPEDLLWNKTRISPGFIYILGAVEVISVDLTIAYNGLHNRPSREFPFEDDVPSEQLSTVISFLQWFPTGTTQREIEKGRDELSIRVMSEKNTSPSQIRHQELVPTYSLYTLLKTLITKDGSMEIL